MKFNHGIEDIKLGLGWVGLFLAILTGAGIIGILWFLVEVIW